ncbi:MAG: tRNA guanosine(34) transglycosylase Tgt [Alphaproteobacteria bacterium]|nr:tRNA guanosine(34) transglycosylase Tgt [Alphaproteobacteria bacterium]MDE2336372.1 tRNA guanosine(34) transglycosylase Tgt [Alphaproteobacteria bacterium]
MTFKFDITHKDPQSRARLGQLTTPHGTIGTPNFIFCGTKAAIKGLSPLQMRAAGTDIILSNTYHLMLSPGADLIAEMGGLHKFTGWDGPMFTDSGGFQIFSLGHGAVADEIKGRGQKHRPKTILKITEEGAEFRSYIDGAKHFLSPEGSVGIQRKLGADLIVQFDECTPFHVDKEYTARSMEMSMRWGDRSLTEHARHDDGTQAMYGIVQGGVYEDLRKTSCDWTRDRPFFATAVGGSLGASKAQMYEVVAMTMAMVHPQRPVHLLGIGSFIDIFTNVRQGIDTFDCVSPTRMARHGWAMVKGAEKERVNIRNAHYRNDQGPIDETCGCQACKNHSRGYIHHLFRVSETLGMQLLSIHNVFTMNRLMRDVRAAIGSGTLDAVEKEWVA